MSRPPGLPARPPNGPYDQRGNSYRPLPPPANNYSSRDSYGRNGDAHRESDRYQFRGNGYSNGDESRPPGTTSSNYHREKSPPSRFGGGDSYRPPSSDFSFRQEAPPSLDLSRTHDSYRPQLRPARQGPLRGNRRHDGRDGGRDGNRYSERKRGGYQNRGGFSRKAAERPFLNTNRAPTPELMPGMDEADGHGTKYLAFEDLSDSEEAEMDLSSDDDGGSNTDEQPNKKQARTEIKSAADGDSVPRWSNPDPYTALPPPDESRGKKKDVVKLIRKARVTATHDDSAMASAAADDFISFDFDEVEEEEEVEEEGIVSGSDREDSVTGVPGAPTGPRNDANSYSHRDAIHGKPEPKPQQEPQHPETPKQKPFKMDITSNPDLGNRKRTHDDEIKGPSLVLKPAPKYAAKGHVLREWKCPVGSDPTPWCIVDHSATANMGFWHVIYHKYSHVLTANSI
jgi:non-canonical poly(A) RNA polymerase PAPD5/7